MMSCRLLARSALFLSGALVWGCGGRSSLLSSSSASAGGGFGGNGGFGGEGGSGGPAGSGGAAGAAGAGGCGSVPEKCDGLDNDCDGAVDEGNPGGGLGCPTGLPGVCSTGKTACTGGTVQCLPDVTPSAEACNSLDDDCDGAVDEGNPGGGAPCVTGLPGVCSAGTITCKNGMLTCPQNVMPSPESCNGLDDDCDGAIDDGLAFCKCTMATFGGHSYAFCPQPSTWNAGLAVCTSGGYHLAAINSAAENDFVFNTANTISNEKWWIGLNDIANEGTFVWEDGSPVTYTNWEPGEPNNSGNEDCGQINRFYPKATWNDEPCGFQLFFVCESP